MPPWSKHVLLIVLATTANALTLRPITNTRFGIHTPRTTPPTPRTTPPTTSRTTQLQSTSEKAKAGEDGYSLLRQPLTWDSESDPSFAAPLALDEDKEDGANGSSKANKDWFDSRTTANANAAAAKNKKKNGVVSKEQRELDQSHAHIGGDKIEFQQELDLFQRTMDTLDYPIVLNALKDNCGTVPARQIVDRAIRHEKKNQKSSSSSTSKRKFKEGSIINMGLTATNVQGVHERYQAVKEMKIILSGYAEIPRDANGKNKTKKIAAPPLSSSFDVSPMWTKVDMGGVLDGPDILEISTMLKSCITVFYWCQDLERSVVWTIPGLEEEEGNDGGGGGGGAPPFEQLPKYGKSIYIDPDLMELLESAFDDEGRLSGTTFQGIGRLRAKVRTLKRDILSTLDTLMSSPSVKNKVSMESGGALYSEVNGRIVIPISEQYSNSVGIVHDVSRSGKTAYIEPSEIVRPTNEMNQAIMELRQEESKVWRMLTNGIMDNRDDIEKSIAVVAQLDLVLARIRLADRIAGVIPQVGDEGVISLKNAKHPVLLLRELDNVVGSDIDIGGGDNQGLVRVCLIYLGALADFASFCFIMAAHAHALAHALAHHINGASFIMQVLTGPNSGGKTVILKLLGLCALMARDGIPIPAQPDSARVDFFGPVLADIGDLQSVDDDLSTFSGHMLVCREVLASSGKNALVLMDELGSGTDPNQGVAIAQAILEALLETGSRVAITTHYLQLKQLAASDNR